MSAHSMSEVLSRSTLRSTNRSSPEGGSQAETVSNPSGGKAQRLPSNGSAWRKLQYVSGNSGLTSRTFIDSLLGSSKRYVATPDGRLTANVNLFGGTRSVRSISVLLQISFTLQTLLRAKLEDVAGLALQHLANALKSIESDSLRPVLLQPPQRCMTYAGFLSQPVE